MMILPITLAAAAMCALLNLWLALRITRRRVGGKVMMGDGGDPMMISNGRAHANFAEYAPFFVLLVAAIELASGPSLWLWLAVALFVLARIAHPIGMDRPAPNPFRAGGSIVTWVLLLVLALWALVIAGEAMHAPNAHPEPAESVFPAG